MPKTIVVTFGELGAKILVNPEVEAYEKLIHIVNPVLDSVKQFPPHMWSLVEGNVVRAADSVIQEVESKLNLKSTAVFKTAVTPPTPTPAPTPIPAPALVSAAAPEPQPSWLPGLVIVQLIVSILILGLVIGR